MVALQSYPSDYTTQTFGIIYGPVLLPGAFTGPVIFGALLESVSPTVAALFLALCHLCSLAVSVCICVWLGKKKKKKSSIQAGSAA